MHPTSCATASPTLGGWWPNNQNLVGNWAQSFSNQNGWFPQNNELTPAFDVNGNVTTAGNVPEPSAIALTALGVAGPLIVSVGALIERKGAKTALITTDGFRDVYEIGRINRPDAYNLFFQKHQPLIERALCFEVKERVRADGEVLIPLDEEGELERGPCGRVRS